MGESSVMGSMIKRRDDGRAFFKEFKGPKSNARTPLAKESEKRKAEKVIYALKRAQYLTVHPFCEFKGCTKLASDIHHRAKRGSNYLDVSTFFGTCRHHHRWIHDNPNEARELGLLV
jgi:hypothetical protein